MARRTRYQGQPVRGGTLDLQGRKRRCCPDRAARELRLYGKADAGPTPAARTWRRWAAAVFPLRRSRPVRSLDHRRDYPAWLPTIPIGTARPLWSSTSAGNGSPITTRSHLFDVDVPGTDEQYMESSIIEPGADSVVLDSPCGRLGVAVCYDLRFLELFRHMLNSGLELLTIPAAFPRLRARPHWGTLVRGGPGPSRTWPMW